MTIKDIIKELKAKGYDIEFYKRTDGGYLIKAIDGVEYKGAKGNSAARQIAGASISSKRAQQLQSIKPTKTQLSTTLKKEIAKTQRVINKYREKIEGAERSKITTKGVRKALKYENEEEVIRKLQQARRYAHGFAYDKNIEMLIERIELIGINKKLDVSQIISAIRKRAAKLKDSDLMRIYNIVYELDKGTISLQQATLNIEVILKV